MTNAPFTDQQVKNIYEFQFNAPVHPFTCGNEKHKLKKENRLVPFTGGLICPGCGYRQYWVHDNMADGSFAAEMKKFMN